MQVADKKIGPREAQMRAWREAEAERREAEQRRQAAEAKKTSKGAKK